jgi:S1-C subfamily serine protease
MEKYAKDSFIPKIVKKALPAVVSITVSKMLPVLDHPTIFTKKKINVGGGSGFIVSSDGTVLTNRHVVNDPKADYMVIVDEEKKYPAKVLAKDPINDVAILKIDGKNLPIIKLGSSSKLELGRTVIAIGNVLGTFQNTVSVGVISGLSREITAGDVITKETAKLRGLIQTDAAINPGNSGGPLIDMHGKAIGINAAMVFMAENIGFALPINNAKKDLEDLKKYGRIYQPFLGLRYILLNKELQERFKLPVDYGALIVSEPTPEGKAVIPQSAAAKAGIKERDIILETENEKITEKNPIEDVLQRCRVGQTVVLKALRNGKKINFRVILDERSE